MTLAVFSSKRRIGEIALNGSVLTASSAGLQDVADTALARHGGNAQAAYESLRGFTNGYVTIVPAADSIAAQALRETETANGSLAAQALGLAYNPAELRDSRGRWTRFGGVGGAADTAMKEREGFSVSPRTGEPPPGGYMVAQTGATHTYPESILDDHTALTRAIDDMLMGEPQAFTSTDTYLGGWVHDGKLWLEPSDNFTSRDQAEAEGRRRNQIAIFDLNTYNEIPTGGSGGGRITEH